jgi:hypothetical protein
MRSWIVTAATLAAAVVTAHGENVIAEYNIDNPEAGPVSLNFFQFGYTDGGGDFIPLTGAHIEQAQVKINFRPGLVPGPGPHQVPFDVDQLRVSMVVPVLLDDPKGTELFLVEGTQLVETSPGTFTFNLTTDAFNGEIRSGRFSLDIGAFDEQGEPVPMAGEFFGGSGFYYTVAVPEPASVGLLAVASLVLRRRRG